MTDPCKTVVAGANQLVIRELNKALRDITKGLENVTNDIVRDLKEASSKIDTFAEDAVNGLNTAVDGINYFTGNITTLATVFFNFVSGKLIAFLQFVAVVIAATLDPSGKLIGFHSALRWGGHGLLFILLLPFITVILFITNNVTALLD